MLSIDDRQWIFDRLVRSIAFAIKARQRHILVLQRSHALGQQRERTAIDSNDTDIQRRPDLEQFQLMNDSVPFRFCVSVEPVWRCNICYIPFPEPLDSCSLMKMFLAWVASHFMQFVRDQRSASVRMVQVSRPGSQPEFSSDVNDNLSMSKSNRCPCSRFWLSGDMSIQRLAVNQQRSNCHPVDRIAGAVSSEGLQVQMRHPLHFQKIFSKPIPLFPSLFV